MTETAKGIYESSVPFSILLQELSLVIPENVRLQTLTATVPPAMLPGTALAEGAAPAAAGTCGRDVHRADRGTPRRGRVHDEARPHPADHGDHAHQLDGVELHHGTTTTASSAPAATYTQFTVTSQLRPYTTHAASHHAVDGGGAMRARGREIYIITAVVAVVLIVAWYFLLFSPTQSKLSDLDQQVQSAQSALDVANQEVVKLESYKKTAPQSRAEIVRLGKMLPEAEDVPGLIIELTKTAEASGVSVTSITRGTTTARQPVRHPDPDAAVGGRYFDVEDFLYRLEEYVAFRNASFRVTGRLLQVTTLSLTASTAATTSGSPELAVTHRPQRLSVGRHERKQRGRGRYAMSNNRRVLTYIAIALHRRRRARARGGAVQQWSGSVGRHGVRRRRQGRRGGLLGRLGDGRARRGRSRQRAADARQVHEQGPLHPVPDAGRDHCVHGEPKPQPDEHVRAVEPLGQGQGGRDVLQRDAGRQGARRFGRRVHHHRRHVRATSPSRSSTASSRTARSPSTSTWARPSA